MKFFILVPDGCGDWKIPALGGKTPLEVALIPHINALAGRSEVGLVQTIPEGMEPGSDVANLAVLGYDPATCLTGRAPLEAAAMGVEVGDDELAIRTNLVTLSEDSTVSNESICDYPNLKIKDHSAGEIENADAEILMQFIAETLGGEGLRFYPGVSYRCLLIAKNIGTDLKTTPPHDVLEQKIADYLPSDEKLRGLMRKSFELLKNHPLNIERVKSGKLPANSLWFWGQGKKMSLGSHEEKYGVKGTMITAVNLLKGIGGSAGLVCPSVPGATGTLHTNYEGKAQYAIDAFESGKDFVFLHVEAPDECSHSGDLDGKLLSLEYIDRRVFKTVHEYLQNCGEPYRILILPDHFTPLETRTHSADPVPFVLYDSAANTPAGGNTFSEDCGAHGRKFPSGAALAEYFFRR